LFTEYAWVIWFFIAIISFVIEVRTPTFFVVCFGVGALSAMLIAMLTKGELFRLQLAVFAIGSFAAFLVIRRFTKKSKEKKSKIQTNVTALIGDIALVTRDVGYGIQEGEVRIRGDYWRALSTNGRIHKKDELVIIEGREGNLLFVRAFDENKEVIP